MAKLTITHNAMRKCISFTYDYAHQFNIFDVEENSEVLELFYRLKYALDKNFEIKMTEEQE